MAEEDCNLATSLSEHEEAPSLSDLPLTAGEEHTSPDRRRSMSEPADFFEFMMPNLDCSSYTFSWNDLVWPSISTAAATDDDEQLFFSSDQRVPLTAAPQQSLLLCPSPAVSAPRHIKTRRSESLNDSKTAAHFFRIEEASSILISPCFRPSRSLDYCRLRRDPSSAARSTRTSYEDTLDRASRGRAQPRSPPWYWLMFGPLRLPPSPAVEIEMRRSAKGRQTRPPATLFPAGEKVSGERKGWKLISVLSCKSHASVAVTTPFQPYC